MAKIDRSVKGRSFEDYLIELPGTAEKMRKYAFELESYAVANLEEARSYSLIIGRPFQENAEIIARLVNKRKNTWEVELNDEDRTGDSRQGAAGNIESGRRDYWNRQTGEPYGGMEGLEVLAMAVQALKDRHRLSLRRR